ncbi:MAG TPA: MFS transporter [Candidatus Sulfotelmatobacter sp.]|nr:MFS transporter [Candidatus Sulfotelmatobacter sp.]
MVDGSAVVRGTGFRAVSRYQWLVFLVVWLGWTLDAADFGLFSLVLRPALTELLGFPAAGNLEPGQLALLGKTGGLLAMTGLLGWAFGGFFFGIIADYIGRVRALMCSIALYSVFTALQGVSHGIWDFATYRFIAGLGTGAELMVGIPLLAETLGETHRAKIAGVMMTGGALGTFIGAWAYGLVGGFGWRYVFFLGVAPALILMLVRRRVMEPDHFNAVQARRHALAAGQRVADDDHHFRRFVPMQLFTPQNRHSTLVGVLFGLGSLLAIWTTNIWLPTILSLMVQKNGISGADAVPFVSHGIMIWSLGGICGYIVFGFVADAIGRRATIGLYSLGTMVAGVILYIYLTAYQPWYPVVLPIFGFFVFGTFSGFAVYLPELFPTQVRATAVGFTTGSARVITSFGPLVAGLLVSTFGSFNRVTGVFSCLAIFSIIAVLIGRETKNSGLPR